MSIRIWGPLAMFAAGFFLWSCSDDDETPTEIDTTPPAVAATFPVDGDTDVSVNVNILVGFSEDMAVAGLNKSTI